MSESYVIEEESKIIKAIVSLKNAYIKVVSVEVLLGGNFTLSLFDLEKDNYKSEEVFKINPKEGDSIKVNKTIEHDLAYTLKCFDDLKFKVKVVYQGDPRRTFPSEPLGSLD